MDLARQRPNSAPADQSRAEERRLHVRVLCVQRFQEARPDRDSVADRPYQVFYVLDGSVHVSAQGVGGFIPAAHLMIMAAGNVSMSSERGCRVLIISPSRSAIGPYETALARASGIAVATEAGAASLVGHVLHALATQQEAFRSEYALRWAQHIVGMVALMCMEVRPPERSEFFSIVQSAKEYIEANLSDLELTPDGVARAVCVSTRTLYRAFESEGLTISGWIRTRRLEQCKAELEDIPPSECSVSAVGARWGLYDAAHFSRLFKAQYGLSPRAYRIALSRRLMSGAS